MRHMSVITRRLALLACGAWVALAWPLAAQAQTRELRVGVASHVRSWT